MEPLNEYYTNNPEWEKRRFELIKGFAIAQYQASAIEKKGAAYIGLEYRLCKEADKVLATINPEIAELIKTTN